MSLETDVRYLLDRIEIQDKVALYGLGQDFHQADAENKNILEQLSELFTPDARIDISDFGKPECGQQRLYKRYAKLTARGKDKRKIVTAVGRELLGFIWAIGTKAEANVAQRSAA